MFVKICGITRLEDARSAIPGCEDGEDREDGAAAVGFICWPQSPRFITPDRIRTIADALPSTIWKVGVFVNERLERIQNVCELAGLTHVQLHGDESPEFAAAIGRPVIKAMDLTRGSDEAAHWPADVSILVDAHDPSRRGGTGKPADWSAAARLARTHRVILAGGLGPSNVAEAIRQVQPFGLDVSSGVEVAPGIKDRGKIAALFEAIRYGTQK